MPEQVLAVVAELEPVLVAPAVLLVQAVLAEPELVPPVVGAVESLPFVGWAPAVLVSACCLSGLVL